MGMVAVMMVDAVIPAWNEGRTIGPIVRTLTEHPGIHHVWVCIDAKTEDDTAVVAGINHARVLEEEAVGKGQCVNAGLKHVDTPRVLFCDADIMGLTSKHVDQLIKIRPRVPMVIGVCDFPRWQDIPDKFARDQFVYSWPWVSGQRCMSSMVAKGVDLYGYLMETQLNQANHTAGRGVVFERLEGCESRLDFNPKRLADMERHLHYGRKMGILP